MQYSSANSVPFFPEEDSKLRATSLQVRRGGNCPNSLEVLQQLLQLPPERAGSPPPPRVLAHLVSCLPAADSSATAKILSSFGVAKDAAVAATAAITKMTVSSLSAEPTKKGRDVGGGEDGGAGRGAGAVDFGYCLYREGHSEPASSYIIRSEDSASRTIVNFNDLPEMTVAEFAAVADDFRKKGDETLWHFEVSIVERPLLDFAARGFPTPVSCFCLVFPLSFGFAVLCLPMHKCERGS